MAGIKGANTRPEIQVRSFLHKMGFRFRLHQSQLPGTPDIVLGRFRVCIFVHGCFWHRHTDCKLASTPKSRADFWQQKFDGNVRRDFINQTLLHADGWKIAVIWECGLRKHGTAGLAWLPEWITSGTENIEWPS